MTGNDLFLVEKGAKNIQICQYGFK